MKKWILAAAMASALPVAAHAQDTSITDDYFSGPYVGVSIAHKTVKNSFDPANIVTSEAKAKGWAPGVVAGYNIAVSEHFVLGAEANLDNLLKKKASYTNAAGKTFTYDPSFTYGVGARAGVLLMPQLMAYGRVGWARMQGDLLTSTPSSTKGGAPTLTKESSRASGMNYGGGIEYAINGRVSVRAEYRHEDSNTDRTASNIAMALGMRF